METNWNSNDAVKELVKFIAAAPKLKYCDISRQINKPEIELERQKAYNRVSGHVRAINEWTGDFICEVETSLKTDITIINVKAPLF